LIVPERKASVWIGIASVFLSGAATAQLGKPAPAKNPPAKRSAQAAPADEIRTAHDLLVALEKTGDSIETLQASVVYDRLFKLQGDRHIRRGTLLFQNVPNPDGDKPTRTFAILFKSLQIGDERLEQTPQTWVFDGRWLVEIRENERQFIKREVARPGEPFDPLKIGEGPMPIPIGQKAEEIERRYSAELMEPRSGLPETWKFPAWLDETWQIVLTPRNPAADEFTGIRLWYEKDTLLPRMAITLNRAGDESRVYLQDVKQNEPLPKQRLSVDEPPPNAGWQVQIETLPDLDVGELDAPR
jgi:hypothetical protein